jgi:hypothetical protein
VTESKTNRRGRFLLLWIGGLGVFLGAGYQVIQARLNQPDIQALAESKATELLKVETKIGRVRYLPLARLALQKIEMKEPFADTQLTLAEMDELILGYGLLNLIRRDFKTPSVVVLTKPKIRFRSGLSPFPFLASVGGEEAKGFLGELGIRGGQFFYPWGESGKELQLSRVNFQAKPDVRGRIRLELSAELGGIATGSVKVRGETDPRFHDYELEVELNDVTFLPESGIPLRRARGKFRVSDETIEIVGLASFLHDWSVQWKGRIDRWQADPLVQLTLSQKKGGTPFRLSVQADFSAGELSGEWFWPGGTYPFRGKVRREERTILLEDLELPHRYRGAGQIDASSGNYVLSLEQDRRRFQIRSNLNRLEFDTDFQLDHASINHLDWVVLGKIRLVPLPRQAGEKGPRFRGELKTDHLIIEYEPFQDFQGTFELDSDGVEAIDFRWGGKFHLNGRVLLHAGEVREDLALRIEEVSLGELRSFAGRPIPSNLTGALEGKLKLRGEAKRPEVQGYFTIKEGTVDQIEFDRAVIQFQGFPPYLEVHDSKIFKGRNIFQLKGAIDLRLQNLFHGIQIQRPDHYVIWKGMSIYWKGDEPAIEADKPVGQRIAMGLDLGSGVSDSNGEDREESHALVGPKIRF